MAGGKRSHTARNRNVQFPHQSGAPPSRVDLGQAKRPKPLPKTVPVEDRIECNEDDLLHVVSAAEEARMEANAPFCCAVCKCSDDTPGKGEWIEPEAASQNETTPLELQFHDHRKCCHGLGGHSKDWHMPFQAAVEKGVEEVSRREQEPEEIERRKTALREGRRRYDPFLNTRYRQWETGETDWKRTTWADREGQSVVLYPSSLTTSHGHTLPSCSSIESPVRSQQELRDAIG